MLVRNRMSRPAVTVRQDAEFQKALALMQEKKLRRLPVVDDDGRLSASSSSATCWSRRCATCSRASRSATS